MGSALHSPWMGSVGALRSRGSAQHEGCSFLGSRGWAQWQSRAVPAPPHPPPRRSSALPTLTYGQQSRPRAQGVGSSARKDLWEPGSFTA